MRIRKPLAALAVAAATVTAAGVAVAAWTAEGTGSGYAKASEAQDLGTVDAIARTDAQLYPGGTGDLFLTITNPNPYPVQITTVSGGGAITSSDPGCNVSSVSFAGYTGALNIAKDSDGLFTLADVVSMNNSSLDACQGAVFTIPVTFSGASNAS